MTDNERIARWRFGDIKPDEHGRGPHEAFWWTGELFYSEVMPDPEGAGETALYFCPFSPDTDLELWHGPSGLLKLIEERGIRTQFVNQWMKVNDWRGLGDDGTWNHGLSPGAIWAFRCASAAELSAALVAVIKEET